MILVTYLRNFVINDYNRCLFCAEECVKMGGKYIKNQRCINKLCELDFEVNYDRRNACTWLQITHEKYRFWAEEANPKYEGVELGVFSKSDPKVSCRKLDNLPHTATAKEFLERVEKYVKLRGFA